MAKHIDEGCGGMTYEYPCEVCGKSTWDSCKELCDACAFEYEDPMSWTQEAFEQGLDAYRAGRPCRTSHEGRLEMWFVRGFAHGFETEGAFHAFLTHGCAGW